MWIAGACFPSPCENGGNCKVDKEGMPKCECGYDWIGDNCTVGKYISN